MFDAITDLIQRSLRLLGFGINSQFFFSYLLIFCCAALTYISSVRDHPAGHGRGAAHAQPEDGQGEHPGPNVEEADEGRLSVRRRPERR